jgi:hypothetical protein
MTELARQFLTYRPAIERSIAEAALNDLDFRRELRRNPRAAVEGLIGCTLPDGLEVEIVEQPPTTIIAAVPQEFATEDELCDADLAGVSGGTAAGSGGEEALDTTALQRAVERDTGRFETLSDAFRTGREGGPSIHDVKW